MLEKMWTHLHLWKVHLNIQVTAIVSMKFIEGFFTVEALPAFIMKPAPQ